LPSVEHIQSQRALQRRLFDHGYAGITWPTEYGGQGLTTEHQRAFDEESVGYAMPDFRPLDKTTFIVCGQTLLAHASHEFKSIHIPKILAGEELWAQFFSEPDAGSDLAAVRTRAVRDGDGWLLNGSKIWSSGATLADYGLCLARTEWSVPKHSGLTWFAVPCDSDGLTIRQIRESNGGQEFCEEFFDDMLVPDSNRIGEINDGWTVTNTMLIFERSAGNLSYGGPPGPLAPDLVELARRRGIETDQHVRQQIARAHTNDYFHRQLGLRIATGLGSKRMTSAFASYVKLAEGVFTAQRARIRLEIGGPSAIAWTEGDTTSRSVAIAYLNARLRAIAGGTNEMQRNSIGERVLGLPREPSFDKGKPFDEVLRDASVR
jgi:alkylation response protein AidB-like acyl-CoA dehydrogenase